MCGAFQHRNIRIYFSADELFVGPRGISLLEYKMTKDEAADWYFQSSVIQAACYGAMARYSDKKFRTMTLYRSIADHSLDLAKKKTVHSRLIFGEQKFTIVSDDIACIRFLLTKARASLTFDRAKRFDATYKHREWELWFKERVEVRRWK